LFFRYSKLKYTRDSASSLEIVENLMVISEVLNGVNTHTLPQLPYNLYRATIEASFGLRRCPA